MLLCFLLLVQVVRLFLVIWIIVGGRRCTFGLLAIASNLQRLLLVVGRADWCAELGYVVHLPLVWWVLALFLKLMLLLIDSVFGEKVVANAVTTCAAGFFALRCTVLDRGLEGNFVRIRWSLVRSSLQIIPVLTVLVLRRKISLSLVVKILGVEIVVSLAWFRGSCRHYLSSVISAHRWWLVSRIDPAFTIILPIHLILIDAWCHWGVIDIVFMDQFDLKTAFSWDRLWLLAPCCGIHKLSRHLNWITFVGHRGVVDEFYLVVFNLHFCYSTPICGSWSWNAWACSVAVCQHRLAYDLTVVCGTTLRCLFRSACGVLNLILLLFDLHGSIKIVMLISSFRASTI